MIEASAPIRVCDLGGWTDTWFGGPGRVLNIAVGPGVNVSICAAPGRSRVLLDVVSFGDRYSIVPGTPRLARHRLLEAAIDALPPPADLAVDITVRSAVPAGCGTGTSAAVAVALLGALAALRSEGLSPGDVAYRAHRLEVDALGGQSGIQDQLSVAMGGINYLEIDAYPVARATALPAWDDLSARLTVLYLGQAHDSSDVHRQVIEDTGAQRSLALSLLREAAIAGRDAVASQDLSAFGQAMIANTDAQRLLHAELVGQDARRIIEVAAAHKATGWKVNGAGGNGGSMTILSATEDDKEAIDGRISAMTDRYRVLPVQVSASGLCVRGTL